LNSGQAYSDRKFRIKGNARFLEALFVFVCSVFLFINYRYVSQNLNLPQKVVVELKTDSPIQLQVYYDTGDGYGEKDKRIRLVPANKAFQRVEIRLPSRFLRSFRIDPLTEPGVVYIKSITLKSWWTRSHSWPADQIVKQFGSLNDISQFELQGDAVKVRSVGIDPYFISTGPIPRINEISWKWGFLISVVFAMACLLVFRIFVWIKENWQAATNQHSPSALDMGLIGAGVAIPLFLAADFVRRNGVNIPLLDQWEFVPLLSAFFEGKPWIRFLIDFHNEHRIIVPRVIFLGLAVITQWNVVAEMYVNLFFLVILLVVLRKLLKDTGGHPILLVPVSWLLFSLQQWENLLWGWQIAISAMLTASVMTILCLSRVQRQRTYTLPALLLGAVASFSYIAGLCVWPVGFIQLLMMRARKSIGLTWLIGGALVFLFYFKGYHKPAETPGVFIFLKNPFDFVKYILAYLGSALSGDNLRQGIVYGAVVIVLFTSVVTVQRLRMKQWETMIPWVMVGLFSLLSGGMVGIGRVGYGIGQALSSRYTSLSLLFLIATLILSVGTMANLNGKWKNVVVIILLVTALILFSGYIHSSLSGAREGYYRKLTLGQFSRSLYHLEDPDDNELKMLYWDVRVLKYRAAVLRQLKLGPYAAETK